MNSAALPNQTEEPPETPGVLFGRSADGMHVALVGDHAYAMAPARDGKFILVSAWRLRKPMPEWTRDDFYGHSGALADEAAFRARAHEYAEHQHEKQALGRTERRLPISVVISLWSFGREASDLCWWPRRQHPAFRQA